MNVLRCNTAYGEKNKLDAWSPTDYGCALAGEVGELCNYLKKVKRGSNIAISEIAKECADVFIYLDLLCARLDIDLEEEIISKFNEVSDRVDCDIKL